MLTGFATSISDPTSSYAEARALGSQSLRVDAPWVAVELRRGVFKMPATLNAQLKAMAANGQEPLLILDYSNPLYCTNNAKPLTPNQIARFGDYAVWLVTKLAGRVRYFELWNEWETKCGGGLPGTADQYMALANAVVPRLRAARPDAIILSAGMSRPAMDTGYVDRVLALGGATLFDGLAFHPYAICPSDTPASCMAKLDAIQAKAAAIAGKPVPFYVTEVGWSTYSPRPAGYDESAQAGNLSAWALLCQARSWIEGNWTYCLRDQGTDPAQKEDNFGVLTNAMATKPAAAAFKTAATQ